MIKLLIADDNSHRLKKLNTEIKKLNNYDYLDIDIVECANDAKRLMKVKRYDLLILDVVLPNRKEATPSSKQGLSTLSKINTRSEYLTPTKIIGITAFIDDMGEFQDQFYQYTSVIFEAQINSSEWIKKICITIENLLQTAVAEATSQTTVSLITVHGIRTHGKWQNELDNLVKTNSREVYPCHIKYGFFSLFSFLIPMFRDYISKKISKKIHKEFDKHSNKKIIIVGHSFGTYIVSKAIETYTGSSTLELVILAGSVLKTDYDVNNITIKSKRLINECGSKDLILSICNMFVLGLGDAGRVGFISPQDKSFINRYYNGGHSSYLTKNNMKKNWLPYIISKKELQLIDERTTPWHSDVSEFLIQATSNFKPIFYILPLYYLVDYLYFR
ncbi:lipase family protein [Vibrio parahaemolyticus]|nr:hypothetical protein [Vibrio parahaemolyticus]HCE3202602.1 hypothetical protein [Vibrio parahaemolyticus]